MSRGIYSQKSTEGESLQEIELSLLAINNIILIAGPRQSSVAMLASCIKYGGVCWMQKNAQRVGGLTLE